MNIIYMMSFLSLKFINYHKIMNNIILANAEHLKEIALLFDQYRVFYGQPSNLSAAQQFLEERFKNQDSRIFLALDQEKGIGFTQLYPSFSSVSMQPIWILNDLFVIASHRRQGIAKELMNTAAKYARDTGAIKLVLATQKTNIAAQTLYKSLGYELNDEFDHFSLKL